MKISILTACYNNAKFIQQCADSILGQKHIDNLEWIVVDDHSDDGSWDVIASISDKRVVSSRNDARQYCSSTYAAALSMATGDICGVVDGDDVLAKDAIHTIIDLYQRHPKLGYIYTQHYWCNESLKVERRGLSSHPGKRSFAELTTKGKHCFSHWRTFRRMLSPKTELFPDGLRYAVDKNLGFALQSISRGGFYNRPLYYYRYYKGNMSLVHARDQKKTWMNLATSYRKKSAYPVEIIT